MEKGFTKFNEHTVEERSALIDRLIKIAKDNAVSIEDYESGNYDESRLGVATIHLTDLVSFRLALEKLKFPEDELMDTLEHENAHSNKAGEIGALEEGYKIIAIKTPGGYVYQPQVNLYIPDSWTIERQRQALKSIAQAPEEYGNSLSPDDEKDLKNL